MTPVIHYFRPSSVLPFPAQTLPRSTDKAWVGGGGCVGCTKRVALFCMANVANPLMRGTAACGGQGPKEALAAEASGMYHTNKLAGLE